MRRHSVIVILFLGLALSTFAQDITIKPTLTVLDFSISEVSEAEAQIFTDVLSTHIVATQAFQLIDRQQRQAILEEIEFSYSDCSDEHCQLEIGKLLSAQQLVVGSIGQIGEWLIVSVRRLDVAGGQTLFSVSEKYTSLGEAVDGVNRLVEGVLGRAVLTNSSENKTTSARLLISSAKKEELENQLERLRRRVKVEKYERWLEANQFSDYEMGAIVEEKIAFLEEYLYQANTHGHAVDVVPFFTYFDLERRDPLDDDYESVEGGIFGITAAWSYQFSNRFSTGLSVFCALQRGKSKPYGAPGPATDENANCIGLGPLIILGNKVESVAVLFSPGIMGFELNVFSFPIRFGLYYRNYYLGYRCSYLRIGKLTV